jgi:tetratricopeptide (TPR) repeat protein
VLWFEKAIQQFPHQVAPYGNLALVYERLGKFDAAMRLTSNAISIMPDNALLYHNMGNILQQLSRNDEALEYFKVRQVC